MRRFLLYFVMVLSSRAADFEKEVRPVLATRCYGCHGASMQASGLRLDVRESAMAGGYSGPVILPGRGKDSRLYRVIAGTDGKLAMPPTGPRVPAEQREAIREWIDSGAPWPADTNGAPQTRNTPRHWSFIAPSRPPVPRVPGAWARNPIDTFVLARLTAARVSPSPEAEAATLLRRVYLDVIGLPPGPEQVQAYLADQRPNRYERIVDELLRSPHYGEKWARHWLDLSRYSDSEGNESDFPRPYAWRYRQWLIENLNRDLPFDQFTLQQIAGDLLPDSTVEQKVALGFHRNTASNREGGADIEGERVEQVVDRVNAVALAWLGMTVGCARCHDHKYDPISQKEFYQLFAFFDNADEVNIDAPLPGELGWWLRRRSEYQRKRDELVKPVRGAIDELQPEWERKTRNAAAHPGADHVWDRQRELLGLLWEAGMGGGQLEGWTVLFQDPARRTSRQRDRLEEHFLKYGGPVNLLRFKDAKLAEISKGLDELNKEYPQLTQAPVLTEREEARETYIHLRGDYRSHGIRVTTGTPAVLPPLRSRSAKADRFDLARWLISAEHPLTARVMVNRVWQELFGRGLVGTPEDFGTQGTPPSHPELLDWLAIEFRETGWSMKRLIRTVVTSATYRQSSRVRKDLSGRDPENLLLARQSRLRLPAELVRDAALSVSGLLNPAIGGPSVRPPQPASVIKEGFITTWVDSTGPDRYRRGLYTHMQRTAPYAQLVTFDAPDPTLMCARRERSNSPLQALTLLNDPVFFEAAQALAYRVLTEADMDNASRIRRAFLLCFARQPDSGELSEAAAFLDEQIGIVSKAPHTTIELSPPVPDGVSRRTAAAWVILASSLMNADEFFTRE